MSGDSTLKKWVKQLRYSGEDSTKAKTQEGWPKYGAASAKLSQGNSSFSHKPANSPTKTVLPILPSDKNASISLSTALPPALSDTALRDSLHNIAEEAPTTISPSVKGDPRAHIASVATDRTKVSQDYTDARHEADYICLRDLFLSDPRDDISRIQHTKGPFHKDSYRWIFDHPDFLEWLNGQSRLLWIKGKPGQGKTVLLCNIMNELQNSTNIKMLSYFFCQGNDTSHNSAVAVLRGLIWLLIQQQPSIIWHVRKRYDSVGRALFEGPNALFVLSEILTDILQDLGLTTIYLSIDALDECTTDLRYLLELISRTSSEYSHVKWIVSGRDGYDIERYLSADDLQTRLTLDLEQNAKSVSEALRAYIDESVSKIESLQYNDALRKRVRQTLHQKADGTFLWVHLVLRELENVGLNHIEAVANEAPSSLERIYAQMLEQVHRRGKYREICLLMLSVVILAHRPLHLLELGVLSGLNEGLSSKTERVEKIVKKCGLFLTVQRDHVFIIHLSAKDYLYENYESFQPAGIERGHVDISKRSFDAIARLEKNIYNLDPSFKLKDATLPNPDPLAPVRYSCIFWADHLYLSRNHPKCRRVLADDEVVLRFLKGWFLRWLESLSLLGSLSDGVKSIRRLLEVSDENLQLTIFLRDAEKFILSYGSIIERAPLQTYGSALVFCPRTSEAQKAQWKEKLSFIKTVAGVRDRWGTLRQTLEGHSGYVNAVAWSPDGKTLASASNDCTIRLWDAATGSFRQKLCGHTEWARTVAFSPDGKMLASASNDCTVQIWHATTGVLWKKLEGHTDWVRAVAFSPDGKTLASASNDCTIRLWDADAGTFKQKLEGHTGWVYAVTFSQDSLTLASASLDCTVRLWDTALGALQHTLNGHEGSVRAVAFSLHNNILASASDDCTVRFWNTTRGTLQRTLQGHSGWVRSIAFSPDSKVLASASDDCTVRLWNTISGVLQQTLKVHGGWICNIAFSPDNQTLALALDDCTIQLWDAAMNTPQKMPNGHSSNINAVTFSPDGKSLASASYDYTVRLWNAVTGTLQQTLKEQNWAKVIAFSPNSELLALALDNCTVKLYNAVTGVLQQTLNGHSSYINAIAFSPDGTLLASASNDCAVQLWDILKGIARQKLAHKDRVKAITFSPSSKILASSSDDYTIWLWDVATGEPRQTLKWQSSSWVTAIAFTPNGKLLASASDDHTVKLLNATTGALQQTLETSQVITNLTFSEDGQYLKTNYGLLSIRETTVPDKSPGQALSNHALFVEKEWVTLNGKNLLWLPHEYRPTCAAVNGENVVLGHRSGEITFLNFEFSDHASN